MTQKELQYPNGKFRPQPSYTERELDACIRRIEALPSAIEAITIDLSDHQLDVPYRDGGWTARQVIHHLADSHMNAYIRFKWTLTEPTPVIKAYDQKSWAETPEVRADPALSVNLLKALHVKWVALLRRLTPADLQKEYVHPETKTNIRLDRMVALYAWHGEHHLAHLKIIAQKLT